MNRVLVSIVAFALLVAACSSSDGEGVASLSDTETATVQEAPDDSSAADEEILLDFAACMRDNGVEDFEDPTINADGVPEFNLRGADGERDREALDEAFVACRELLEGLAFGRGGIDLTEVTDTLVEFAACMRENGYDMPDPDLSNLGGDGEGGFGPFGGEIDPTDPDFISATEECEYIFENLPFVGGGGAGRGSG